MSQTLENLELAMAFEDWAKPRGYDLAQESSHYRNMETRAAWLGWEGAHGPDGCRPYGQQIYALIKRESEYAHQSDKLFPVRVGGGHGDYTVHGGVGGVYRIKDVDFFVLDGGQPFPLR